MTRLGDFANPKNSLRRLTLRVSLLGTVGAPASLPLFPSQLHAVVEQDSTPELRRAVEPGPGFPAMLTPTLWLRLVLYDFIELNEYAVWVQGKRTTNRPCGRLEQRVRWDDKLHPFALEVSVDRIQAIDPQSDVRDTT